MSCALNDRTRPLPRRPRLGQSLPRVQARSVFCPGVRPQRELCAKGGRILHGDPAWGGRVRVDEATLGIPYGVQGECTCAVPAAYDDLRVHFSSTIPICGVVDATSLSYVFHISYAVEAPELVHPKIAGQRQYSGLTIKYCLLLQQSVTPHSVCVQDSGTLPSSSFPKFLF